ncbi:unnamed protein product [Calypogeia fissa]
MAGLTRKRPHAAATSSSHPPGPKKHFNNNKSRKLNDGEGKGRGRGRGGGGYSRRHHHGEDEDDSQVAVHSGRHSRTSLGDARDGGGSGSGGNNTARKRLDPQTKSYFLEIASLVDKGGGGESSAEETEAICAQALEESTGKELQLACDPSCGRVLQTLLLSCSVSHNVQFLSRCGAVAFDMTVDPSASHILESALKSLARALLDENVQGEEWYGSLEPTLSIVCQELGTKAVDVMTNRYGSHVLRCLLALLSGDSSEILPQGGPGSKPSRNLADKIGAVTNKPKHGQIVRSKGHAFPNLLKTLVDNILDSCKENMREMRSDVCAGPVLQALLKALQGKPEKVVRAIAMILGCDPEDCEREGAALENASVDEVVAVMEDRSSSHLMEVIIRSASNSLYLEILQRFFRKRLLQLSVHPSANFIVQVLIACIRHEGQVNMIFEELEGNFTDLIFNKRSGVVAALFAACGRFHTRQKEVCRALAVAVNSNRASPTELTPRLLFLESASEDGTFSVDLNTFSDSKMSVIGSVILQTILTFPKECSQQFCASIAAMESGNLLHSIRDASGSRVIEAFLESSAAPAKHKHRIISKLEGHFAELALHPISCFTVEKAFGASDIKLKEKIAAELAPVQADLSKTRNGARISRRCDIVGYTKQPEQWRMKESTKQSTHKAFTELFKPDTEAPVVDDPEEAVFVKKDDSELKQESSKVVPNRGQHSSKKAKKEMKTAAKTSVLQNEKVRMFEAVLRGM